MQCREGGVVTDQEKKEREKESGVGTGRGGEEKVAALHDAQINHTAYRGVEYDQRCVESKETHGTFCYRGRTYTK